MKVVNPSAEKTEQFGVHIMIDGYLPEESAIAPTMTRPDDLEALLQALPVEMGMHPICSPVVVEVGPNCHKDPGGLSGFVMIAESHISFHTFPARGFVTIDLYTCQVNLDRDSCCERIMNAFNLSDADIYIQERGLRYPTTNRVGLDYSQKNQQQTTHLHNTTEAIQNL